MGKFMLLLNSEKRKLQRRVERCWELGWAEGAPLAGEDEEREGSTRLVTGQVPQSRYISPGCKIIFKTEL